VKSRGEAPDRMEDQPLAFFEAVRQGYLDLARAHPERIHLIDASDGIDEIEQTLWLRCRKQFDEFFL
jgi:dTMP kinase